MSNKSFIKVIVEDVTVLVCKNAVGRILLSDLAAIIDKCKVRSATNCLVQLEEGEIACVIY